MLNNRPTGDLWHLQDNDVESQYFEKILHFDFSYIHSEEIKDVVKDYIWQNWKTRSKTLITLQHYIFQFKHFVKFAQQHRLHSLRYLDNVKVDLFLSYLRTTKSNRTGKPLSYDSQRRSLDVLKAIVTWCRIHCPQTVPSVEIFTGNEFIGINRKMRVDYIPDEVMIQINEALKTEENPYLKYGIIILESTGMRKGDLLKLRTDCIKPHLVSGYTISWFEHKTRREHIPLPVRSECAQAVQKLIELTEPLREKSNESIKDRLFIYRPTKGIHAGEISSMERIFKEWLRTFAQKHNILGTDGKLYNITSHQFRRTLGTDMLSNGISLNVVQQVLGHTDPACTRRFYADVKDKERAKIYESIGIIGNIDMIDVSLFENAAEKDWFVTNKHKATLCDGYCTKPVKGNMICERLLNRQKCYSCSRYITTPEYLQAHKDHLFRLEKQLEEGAIYGEHYAEHFYPTIKVLKVIIDRLEKIQNDRTES